MAWIPWWVMSTQVTLNSSARLFIFSSHLWRSLRHVISENQSNLQYDNVLIAKWVLNWLALIVVCKALGNT